MVALVAARTSCGAPASTATSGCARSTTSARPRSASAPTRSSTTASAAQASRRRVRLRDGDRGARLHRRARVARRPLRGRRSRPRRRIPAPPPGERRASGSTRCWTRAARSTRAPVGGPRGGWRSRLSAGPGLHRGDPARVQRRLRAERRGIGSLLRLAAAPGSATRSCWRRGLHSATGSRGGADRPLPRPDHVPDGRRARAQCSVSAPARCGTDQRPEVPQHGRRRALPQARVLYGIELARAAAASRPDGRSSRATPT